MENIQINESVLRGIPQVDKILGDEEIRGFIQLLGRGIVLEVIREEIEKFRNILRENQNAGIDILMSSILRRCCLKRLVRLQRVINGTGVMLHTNLGRAPLSKDILKRLNESLSGYCNLELYIPSKKRGKRGGFCEELICHLLSSDDALIVNNNASSVFLILNEFGKGREVIISRGELVQIGGGFRIPDIMSQTGAHIVEVGTTNITYIDDYLNAINENTAMILSVHKSNYEIRGFADNPSMAGLASLKTPSILFVRDIGSGNLINNSKLPQPFEPSAKTELSYGADLICFSGDKLLGGCQSGIIAGRRDLIQRLKKNPLMRMLRVDKVTYFLLQETLLCYMNNEIEKIPLWNIILQNERTIGGRVGRCIRMIKNQNKSDFIRKIPLTSAFGGGSMPGLKIRSSGLQISIPGMKVDEVYQRFLYEEIPVVGYIFDDKYILDFRTILDRDIVPLASSIDKLLPGSYD